MSMLATEGASSKDEAAEDWDDKEAEAECRKVGRVEGRSPDALKASAWTWLGPCSSEAVAREVSFWFQAIGCDVEPTSAWSMEWPRARTTA